MDAVCRAGGCAGGLASELCHGGAWRSYCEDCFCSCRISGWARAHYVCEGDGGPGAGVAWFSSRLGLCDRSRADCVQSGSAVFGIAACGCRGGGGDGEPVCASCLGSPGDCDAEGTFSVDCISYFVGDCGCRVGGGSEYWDERL